MTLKKLLADEKIDDINQGIIDKKAIPELRYKFNLFVAQERLIASVETLRTNAVLNNNRYSPIDEARLRSSLATLFMYLKYMILEKDNYLKKEREWNIDKQNFMRLNELALRGSKFSTRKYLEMADFLLYWMHELNLTNLLKSEFDPINDFTRF